MSSTGTGSPASATVGPGASSNAAAANTAMRSGKDRPLRSCPVMPDAKQSTPRVPMTTGTSISIGRAASPVAVSMSNSGRYTKMKGRVNPTSAKRNAARLVCMMLVPAIDAAA